MTQNERLTQAELDYLRAKIPPCEPFTDVLKPIDRKAEYSTWLFRLGVILALAGALVGAVLGVGILIGGMK